MGETAIMVMIDEYRDGKRKDIEDLLSQIYEVCEEALGVPEWDELDADEPTDWDDNMDEVGFDPYAGCYGFDC